MRWIFYNMAGATMGMVGDVEGAYRMIEQGRACRPADCAVSVLAGIACVLERT